MFALPGLLGAAMLNVAYIAHLLSVVFPLGMRTVLNGGRLVRNLLGLRLRLGCWRDIVLSLAYYLCSSGLR